MVYISANIFYSGESQSQGQLQKIQLRLQSPEVSHHVPKGISFYLPSAPAGPTTEDNIELASSEGRIPNQS